MDATFSSSFVFLHSSTGQHSELIHHEVYCSRLCPQDEVGKLRPALHAFLFNDLALRLEDLRPQVLSGMGRIDYAFNVHIRSLFIGNLFLHK